MPASSRKTIPSPIWSLQRDEFVKKYNDSVKDRNDVVTKYNDLVKQLQKKVDDDGK